MPFLNDKVKQLHPQAFLPTLQCKMKPTGGDKEYQSYPNLKRLRQKHKKHEARQKRSSQWGLALSFLLRFVHLLDVHNQRQCALACPTWSA